MPLMPARRLPPLLISLTVLAAPLTACGPRMIPHTEIADTPDDRAILIICKRFREAFEARDAEAIVKLASPRYLDSRDNISYASLRDQLQATFDRTKELKLDVTVRRIIVEGDHARADYVFAINFLMNAAEPVWKSQTDDKRMTLERENGEWRVTSGF